MELIYSLNINKTQTEAYCRKFGYTGSTTDELMEFYNNIFITHLMTWSGVFPVKDENDNPVYSYTFNEDV